MESIAISKFKATCLAVLQRVKRSGRPIRVTRFGEPIADVVPPRREGRKERWIGCMEGRAEILGDIIAPASDAADWRALSD
jgi:antitoxin (DNA-binding transcriptional repressor) of toxin-antitoxin stability system